MYILISRSRCELASTEVSVTEENGVLGGMLGWCRHLCVNCRSSHTIIACGQIFHVVPQTPKCKENSVHFLVNEKKEQSCNVQDFY